MGVIKRGILGGFSGRVGSVVGTSWKGIAVIKSLPLSVANPKTAKQVDQRTKFKQTVLLAASILSTIIKPLWDRFASQMSGINAFVQKNVGIWDDALATPFLNFIFAQGKMQATAISGTDFTTPGSDYLLSWLDDSGVGLKLSTDLVYAIVYNETQSNLSTSSAIAVRADLEVVVTSTSALVTADIIHAWLIFKRADGTIVSAQSTISGVVA